MPRVKSAFLWVIAAGVLGCTEFPPHKSEAIQYFHKHRGALRELVEAATNDQRKQVFRGEIDRLIDFPSIPLPQELIKKYKLLFDNAGDMVTSVRVSGEAMRIDIDGSYSASNRNFHLFYLYSNDSIDHGVCDRSRLDAPCGFCSLPIEPPWYLAYGWMSYDYLLQEVEERIPSDVIGHQEREALFAEVVGECHLLRIGGPI